MRYPDDLLAEVDAAAAAAGLSRTAWVLVTLERALHGPSAPPVDEGGRRSVGSDGHVDRMPSGELEARAQRFALATSRKGGPACRLSYPSAASSRGK